LTINYLMFTIKLITGAKKGLLIGSTCVCVLYFCLVGINEFIDIILAFNHSAGMI